MLLITSDQLLTEKVKDVSVPGLRFDVITQWNPEACRDLKPNMILVDLRQLSAPDALVSRIKSEAGHASLIALIDPSLEPLCTHIIEAGADEFMRLPLNTPILEARLRAQMRIRNLIDTLGQKQLHTDTLLRTLTHDFANQIMSAQIRAQKVRSTVGLSNDLQALIERLEDTAKLINIVGESYRKLDTSRLTLTPVNIVASTLRSLRHVKDLFPAKNINFKITKPQQSTPMVMAIDTILEYQILANFLTNAVKFSDANSPVDIVISQVDHEILVEVIDRGTGIAPNKLKMLNEAQDRTESERGTEGERGTGYGILLASSYIKAFGGSLTICSKSANESKDDHGTTVSMRLKSAA